jgi:hypothetical protein
VRPNCFQFTDFNQFQDVQKESRKAFGQQGQEQARSIDIFWSTANSGELFLDFSLIPRFFRNRQ